ncbi:hypothetical protein IJG72_05275 [bacterium]|nr:hypothetical protein [bacterium]
MKRKIIFVLTLLLLSSNVTFATSNYNFEQDDEKYAKMQPLKGHVVSVPAGVVIPIRTTQEISSATLTQGQRVNFMLGSDFYHNNQLVAPAGSTVSGTVTVAKKATFGGINGKLKVVFTQIVTTDGLDIPINGIIKTNDGSGLLVGGTKMDSAKEYVKDLAVGSAVGAVSGVVFGALAGGDVGRGAALGTAVGAGGGVVKSIADKGENVDIPANSTVELILSQPITVNPTSYNY